MRHVAFSVAFALAVTTTSCRREQARDGAAPRAYRYHFYESTGANKFVLIDGIEHRIEFDPGTSDDAALAALFALKWNVLYPNAEGVITLLGTYHPDTQMFSLRHWQLPTRFQAYPGETTLEPGALQWRDALRPTDFDRTLGDDPRIYQGPPRAPP